MCDETDAEELAEALRRHVRLLAGDIGERNVFRPQALRAAAAYITATWQEQGYCVAAQRYAARGVECANLEITLPGSVTGSDMLLVGAHYDTVQGSPGADDNASAVAALLELGRILRTAAPASTVRCVAFVNEEAPFFFLGEMGRLVYARAARQRGDRIRLMLSLEMLGCYRDEPGTQAYPPFLRRFYPDRGNFLGFVSNLRSLAHLRALVQAFRSVSDLPTQAAALPWWVPGVALSDQSSFWRQGYPGVMVTDTAYLRNPHYHTHRDTPDTLDYPRLARATHGLAGALRLLARGP
jgi:Zn-dependent M28 family amino/carboxypeptidase